jgi:hypothetical protein
VASTNHWTMTRGVNASNDLNLGSVSCGAGAEAAAHATA